MFGFDKFRGRSGEVERNQPLDPVKRFKEDVIDIFESGTIKPEIFSGAENYSGISNFDSIRKLWSKIQPDIKIVNYRPGGNKSYGQMYAPENNTIYLNELPMPISFYNNHIYQDSRNLAPSLEKIDHYRFIHESSHAYQNIQMHQDFLNPKMIETGVTNVDRWEGLLENSKAELEAADLYDSLSDYGKLYHYAYHLRLSRGENNQNNLSTFASQPDYSGYSGVERRRLAACEDANELVTMFLWNPWYFTSYLALLKDNHANSLQFKSQARLTTITEAEEGQLFEIVLTYIQNLNK